MRTIIGRGAAVGSVLTVGLLVAACGGSSQPGASGSATPSSSSPAAATQTAQKILPAVDSAVAAATSVHMNGSVVSGSQKVTLDMSFSGAHDMSGAVGEDGGTFSILVTGGKPYIELNASFLKLAKLPSSACATVCGKWVELPASEASQLTGSLSMSALSKQAFGQLPSSVTHDTTDLFEPATYNGQAVLQFQGGGYTIDVTQSSPHYPLLVQDTKGDTVTFSEWNSVPAVTAPPAKDVINLSQLSSSAG